MINGDFLKMIIELQNQLINLCNSAILLINLR